MIIIIKAVLLILLIPIALLHCYWLLGGEWGLDACLPTDLKQIKKKYTAIAILIFRWLSLAPVIGILGVLIIDLVNLIDLIKPYRFQFYCIMGALFSLRAKLGWLLFPFFIKKDLFIQKNNLIFSPVALFLGLAYLGLAFLQ